MTIVRWLDGLGQDARYAVRLLRKSPGFTLAVVLTLAFGIGANTAVFSLINGLLLQRLPVKDPDRLVLVADPSRGSSLPPGVPNQMPFMWSYRLWDEIRQRPELFDRACGFFSTRFDLSAGGETDLVDGMYVSGSFFETLGVSATIGRTLTDADDRRDPNGRVVVIGDDLWRRRFGGAPDAVGRTLTIERLPFTIVGVLPRGFVGPAAGRAIDFAVPLAAAAEIRGRFLFDARGANWITILARLKASQTIEAATTALRGVQPQIRDASRPPRSADRDDEYLRNPLTLLPASRGNALDPLRVRARRPLVTMQIAVVLVLLVVCANLANLTLARGVARRREMSVRLALGASRLRIARQLLVESLLVALVGAALAIPLSRWGLRVLAALVSSGPDPLALDVAPDARVLAFTMLVSVAAAVVIGIAPAGRASRVEPIDGLKEHDGNAFGSRLRLASGFAIVQVAISLVLVVGGGLLVRTYANLATQDLGFDPHGVLVVDVGTRRAHVPPATRLAMFEQVRQAAATIPGVTSAAIADLSPVTGGAMAGDVEVVGGRKGSKETFVNRISPGWLSLYGTSILNGRDFTPADRAGAPRVAIVNQTFVRELFDGGNPLGQVVRQTHLPPGPPPMAWTVVGVAADAVYDSLRAPAPPTLYMVFSQIDDDLVAAASPPSASLSVRVAGAHPATFKRSLTAAIAKVNPELDLTFRPLLDVVSGSLTLERTLAMLAGFFGALSLLLAAIGLYGLTSYQVDQRRREIGIRMALGATRPIVVREMPSRIVPLVAVGIAIGAAVSLWVAQFVTALLFRVPSRDPATFGSAAVVLASVGVLAGWLPARRASRVDPMVTLRHE